MLGDIREAEVATMLSLFQQAGHYASQHGPFHDLRDSLLRDQVCGPNGEPLPLPPVGNWILALGISLLGYDTPAGHELLTRLTNPQTVGGPHGSLGFSAMEPRIPITMHPALRILPAPS